MQHDDLLPSLNHLHLPVVNASSCKRKLQFGPTFFFIFMMTILINSFIFKLPLTLKFFKDNQKRRPGLKSQTDIIAYLIDLCAQLN